MTRPSVQPQLAASAMPGGWVPAVTDQFAGSGLIWAGAIVPRMTLVSRVDGGP
jgi:uncharacterized membrane protein